MLHVDYMFIYLNLIRLQIHILFNKVILVNVGRK
jgi:hypothetical protein